jgi:DNA ligase 1
MCEEAKHVMLAKEWTSKIDPTGWWMSEKLDGVRAYWDGKNLYSRNGIQFVHCPEEWKRNLPSDVHLDGELFMGRGMFSQTLSAVKSSKGDWKRVKYMVFAVPNVDTEFETSDPYLAVIADVMSDVAIHVRQYKCRDAEHLVQFLREVEAAGGEGVMLRKPKSVYDHKRSGSLLKVKSFLDDEALVIAHVKGEGKNSNVVGHLECQFPTGVQFGVGFGLSDEDRVNPPEVGSVITVKYFELTDSGKPRFPVFLVRQPELTWQNVLDYAQTKK